MDTSWISLAAVHDILRRTTSAERSHLGSEGNAKASKYAHQVEAAKSISEKLWSVPDEHEALQSSLDKGGSIVGQQSEPSTNKDTGNCSEDPSSSSKGAHMHYQAFKKKKTPMNGCADCRRAPARKDRARSSFSASRLL